MSTLSDHDWRIYEALCHAASRGYECPSNSILATVAEYAKANTASASVARLEDAGLIRVRRTRISRQVTIADTGESTMPLEKIGEFAAWARLDELAELVANGATVAGAGTKLGLSKSRVWQLWKRICHECGPQAV